MSTYLSEWTPMVMEAALVASGIYCVAVLLALALYGVVRK